jgi:hypothetical protein
MRGTSNLALAGLILVSSTAMLAGPARALDPDQIRTNNLSETNRNGQVERFNTTDMNRFDHRLGSNPIHIQGQNANLYRTPHMTVLRGENGYYIRRHRNMHGQVRYGVNPQYRLQRGF